MHPTLTSTKNPIVQDARRLHTSKERRRSGRILIEGPTLLREAVSAGVELITVFVVTGDHGQLDSVKELDSSVVPVSSHVLSHLGTTSTPRGPIAIARRPEPDPVLGATDCLVLVDIAEPGNAGTMARTAVALGFQVVVVAGSVDVWSPKALRAGAGAQFVSVPHVVASINDLLGIGLFTVALVVKGGGSVDHLDTRDPVAIVVGNEAHGLPSEILSVCHSTLTLEMDGRFESLNAATAGSIVMWERSRRRPG
ncbi:MAG TPA: RNA methyltransferase [Actinobacteria bacterium]|nr:23S rRNA methyltransferase [bacterium BMS3Bbin02]HDL42307.1 RNA methyltransferase [Actinomycetota bacterium]